MKNSKKGSERIWWMILLDAEARSNSSDIDEAYRWMQVSIRARIMLRDFHKVDLDKVSDDSRDLLDQLYDEEVKREKEEEKIRAEVDALLEQAIRNLE